MTARDLSLGLLATLALGGTAQSQPVAAGAAHPLPASTSLTAEQVRDYAGALVAISKARQTAKAELASMPGARQDLFAERMRKQVSEILHRFGLDRPAFEHITAQVDHDPALAQRVQLSVMAVQVGS